MCNAFMNRVLGRIFAPSVLASLLFAAGAAAAQVAEPSLPGIESVLGELRTGGLVIYLRHASTEQTEKPDEDADVDRCETQRNLSADGREQARKIGRAMAALGIKVGAVYSSPFCRCRDTAQLAFGRYAVNEELFFSIRASAEQTRRLSESLRGMLAQPPQPGTNTVIVSHTANLREAAGIWPKPEGVAIVFRPLPGGRFEAVAKVLAQDWALAGGVR